MKFLKLLLLCVFLFSKVSFAQKFELINSGDTIKKGVMLYDSGKYKSALILYNKINKSDTNYVWSLYEKAISCEADSEYNQAIKYCLEGLYLKEQREYEPDLYNTYGNILNDIGQHEKAIKVFDSTIAKYPAYSYLYFNRGINLVALNRLHDAELMFQQTLLVNPYMYSAHYQLGLVALKQGKIIPSFLCFVGYLLVDPHGKYATSAITYLNKISRSTDDILEVKNKRIITPDINYQEMEDIVLSKIALDKAYKPIIELDDAISRQIQVVFEKLEYKENDSDFYNQYYLPYYKQAYDQSKFELFIYHSFANVQIPVIQNYCKKNKKAIEGFETEAANYFNLIRGTRELQFKKRDLITEKYLFENGLLIGKGTLANDGKILTGSWHSLYSAGNNKCIGNFNETGKRQGDWLFYFYSGKLKAKEHYEEGKRQGRQAYYFENGNMSSQENDVNDKAEGIITTYYYCGNKREVINYKQGKKDGEERDFYSNGNLQTISNYTGDVLTGNYQEYYKSGPLKEVQQYIGGKSDGPYKSYFESGSKSVEGAYSKDNAEGEWSYYYENGGIKEKRNYINNLEEGLHQEYYDNGQLTYTCTAKKDKITGEVIYYSKSGIVYAKYIYDKGIITSAKYFNPSGAEISSSESKDDAINIITYSTEGIKNAHVVYNKKGNEDGPDTIFYPSGKINQINEYENGKLNGNSITYYRNGKKRSEINMTNGKQDGYYTGFYVNGQKETEGWVQDGDYQGQWARYDERGKLSLKSYYLNGDIDGYKEEFLPDGKKTTEQKFHRGWLEKITQFDTAGNVLAVDTFPKFTGKYTLLYPNGKVMAQTNYVNGDFNGQYNTYYFDGSPESSFFYKKGLLDSTYVSYYYGGKKYTEGQYVRGNKSGIWKFYEQDGKLSYTSMYVNDMLNGVRNYFTSEGVKDFVSVYKDDVLDGTEVKYDPDGTEAYQLVFEGDDAKAYTYLGKDGKLVPIIPIASNNGFIKAYFQNGKISRESVYSDGVKNGTSNIYYGNGKLRSVDNVIYGVSEGAYKEYYPDGKLKTDYNYLTDNLDGICKEFNKNGTLKKEMTYVNGLSHGPTKYYDENGKLTKTLWYNYDKLIAVKNEK